MNISNIVQLPSFPLQHVLPIAVSILKQYNLRSAELLRLKKSDLHYPRFCIVRGCKGSRDIVIRDKSILSLLLALSNCSHTPFIFNISYSQLYRFILRTLSHRFVSLKGKKNKKVTHAFRYINSSELDNAHDVSLVLNHKSQSSAHFYNKSIKES